MINTILISSLQSHCLLIRASPSQVLTGEFFTFTSSVAQFEKQRSCFQQKTDSQLAMESNPWEQIESAVLPSTGLNPAYPLTSQV